MTEEKNGESTAGGPEMPRNNIQPGCGPIRRTEAEARNLSTPVAYMGRGARYKLVIAEWRAARAEPRPEHSFPVFEDNAPDWVWMLARAIFERCGGLADEGEALVRRALRWCEDGEAPEARSVELQELLKVTRGPRLPALVARLDEGGAPEVDTLVRTARLRVSDGGARFETWDPRKGEAARARTVPELLGLLGLDVANLGGRAVTIELRVGPKASALPGADSGPALLVCPMCVGKGEAPEATVWGPEHGGAPPPWDVTQPRREILLSVTTPEGSRIPLQAGARLEFVASPPPDGAPPGASPTWDVECSSCAGNGFITRGLGMDTQVAQCPSEVCPVPRAQAQRRYAELERRLKPSGRFA